MKKKKKATSAIDVTAQVYALPRLELKEGEDGKVKSTLQLLPEGKFQHPWYGELDFTMPVLRAAKRNFDNNILSITPMVDEGHDRGQALGWFKELHTGKRKIGEQEYSGLFGGVEWTDKGRGLLEADLYRYFSAEVGSFIDPEGNKTPNVIFGGGLTNRPFFKKMPKVKLADGKGQLTDVVSMGLFTDPQWSFTAVESDTEEDEDESDTPAFFIGYDPKAKPRKAAEEDESEDDDDEEEEDEVKLEDLIKKLKKDFGITLSDTATEAEVMAAMSGVAVLSADSRTKLTELGVKLDDSKSVGEQLVVAFTAMKEKSDTNTTAIADIRKELADTKATAAVTALVSEGKLLPAKRDQYIKLYHTDKALFDDMTKDLAPVVELGEVGGDGDPPEPGSAKLDEFKDPTKATEESDRYMRLVPAVAERLPAGRT